MKKNDRPWHSDIFATTVITTLDSQDRQAMSNFIHKIQTGYLDATYETFGSVTYRSKTDDSLIRDIKKAKSLLDKFEKSTIFDLQKQLHTRTGDYNLLQETSVMLNDVLKLNASLHSGPGKPGSLSVFEVIALSYLQKVYQEHFPKLSSRYTRGALITIIGAALLGKERLPNGVEKQLISTKLT
jgi:hypothetical protein